MHALRNFKLAPKYSLGIQNVAICPGDRLQAGEQDLHVCGCAQQKVPRHSATHLSSCSLVDRVGASLGLYSSYRGGRGGHPLAVPQYTKDHLNSIISLPPDWLGNDTTQMILDILAHRQRVSSSPVRADQI